ncbi:MULTISPECIES: DEAD/DEAH box helicase [unclassified Xanthomonas]|uniref:DEAD/DEAH box helicase n=1 Tax=unclassified Xanthomonas TaxID=2643310 RepID=UPI000CEF20FD|nr:MULTISPECIES: DEAD/DEAH box helicase [unclassified Xanthomonas]PPU29877.1 DEAD/DEAH box helicase [Xanthomonas sp. CFBP 7912]RJS01735.1 DEAD/DEAH box helicase [Xanthomonas sp. CFBP 7698]
MSATELQDWLVEDGVRDEIALISRKMVEMEFELSPSKESSADYQPIDWQRLLLAGSILARSRIRSHEETALKIATAAVLLPERKTWRDAGAILLEKLSNHRAVTLAEERALISPRLDGRLGITSRLEAFRRQMETTVLEKFTGKWLPVNDFQRDFWSGASSDETSWLSASAPTASGKTFLVRKWLIDRMLTSDSTVAVYIAPTRALVSEVESSIIELVSEMEVADRIHVASLPLKDSYIVPLKQAKKVILIFTQERLHLLVNAVGDGLRIDLLVVDEAHKIGDGGRGVILQSAIERVASGNPSMRAVFISPATQNPGILLQDAPAIAKKVAVDSDFPTVLQNIILCSPCAGKPLEWMLDLRTPSGMLPIGSLILKNRPTSLLKKIASIAAAVGHRGGTLVYANGAADAEKIAMLIFQQIESDTVIDSELANLADLARKGVHPEYQLANVVERGVAFHYGNMPSLLRQEIEKLFRIGKLRFLVCTSTLVEGVNLSCRTIVVRGPRKGRSHPMGAADFWNLAGRAGRWGNEFQGNIVCIDPNDSDAWPSGVPERSRYPIERETDAVMDRVNELDAYIRARPDAGDREILDNSDLEHVSSYLLEVYMRSGSILDAPFALRRDAADILALNSSLASVVPAIELPADLISRHPGVAALGLQKLLQYFRRFLGREELLLLEPADSDKAYGRFNAIMSAINEHVFPAFQPPSATTVYSIVVLDWLRGYSLRYMIRKRIDYLNRKGKEVKVPLIIRETMELVEQVARFKAPKYIAAYVDVLKFFLAEADRADLLSDDIDIGTALEFGVSTRTMLSLMELGLSRMSAVEINDIIANDQMNQNECLNWMRDNINLIVGSDIPVIIVREVQSIIDSVKNSGV